MVRKQSRTLRRVHLISALFIATIAAGCAILVSRSYLSAETPRVSAEAEARARARARPVVDAGLCEGVSARNSLKSSRAQSAAVRELLTPVPTTRNCAILIVCAGFPRSGSTLQQQLAQIALDALNLTAVAFYWNYHLHNLKNVPNFQENVVDNSTPDAGVVEGLLEQRTQQHQVIKGIEAGPGKNVAVVIKSHHFDAGIMDMCEKQLVITIRRRNVMHAAESATAVGFANNVKAVPIASWQQNYDCWMAQGAVEVLYDDVARHPDWHVAQIAAAIATRLNIDWQPAAVMNMTTQATYYKGHDANPDLPGRLFMGRNVARTD